MLASEAREVLSLALCEVADSALEDVVLDHVDAGPSGIVATLVVPAAGVDAARAALDRIRPRLRAELAAALQRRRVPELSLLVWPSSAPAALGGEGDDGEGEA